MPLYEALVWLMIILPDGGDALTVPPDQLLSVYEIDVWARQHNVERCDEQHLRQQDTLLVTLIIWRVPSCPNVAIYRHFVVVGVCGNGCSLFA